MVFTMQIQVLPYRLGTGQSFDNLTQPASLLDVISKMAKPAFHLGTKRSEL